tara:strand:+ start:1202 stop:1789 length:588 start_codon:yes stop_codon:yes gene_type:complete
MNLGTIWSNSGSFKQNSNTKMNLPRVVNTRPPPSTPSNTNLNVNKKSTRSFWGSATWFFFHTISCRINNDYYAQNYLYVWNFIKRICNTLPCPYCQQHASNYTKNVNMNQINTKEKLKKFLFDFHNSVNSRTGKKVENISILQKYQSANIKKIFDFFEQRFFYSYIGRRQFDDWIKNEVKTEYYKFYNNLRSNFN